jgi:hypothetical protein
MSLKKIARLLGTLYGELNEIEREIKDSIISAIELERLIYSFPINRKDINEIRKELSMSLGGEDPIEAIRRALMKPGKYVRMGGKRCAIVISSPQPPESVLEGIRELVGEVRGGDVELFDTTQYPLASITEMIEYDPDFIIIISQGEGTSVKKIEVKGDIERLKESIPLTLLGVNDVNALTGVIASLSEGEVYIVNVPPLAEGVGCLRTLRDLMVKLGYSF